MSLERAGHTVTGVASVAAARKALSATDTIDLALVDWMLPGGSGLELVRSLRKEEQTRRLPIIMLTARAEEEDISAGLDAGADDYISKPFSPKELVSRINALLRRTRDQLALSDALQVGSLFLNPQSHRVYTNEIEVPLGHTEFKLLRCFMMHPERVFSRDQLLDQVWGNDTYIGERTVDVHILRLRKSLKPAKVDKMLETVRGAGYRLRATTDDSSH